MTNNLGQTGCFSHVDLKSFNILKYIHIDLYTYRYYQKYLGFLHIVSSLKHTLKNMPHLAVKLNRLEIMICHYHRYFILL